MTDQNSRKFETLDNLRYRQEQAWQCGERLLVESLADEVAAPARDAKLLILITAEVTLRRQLGENCKLVEYLERFPQFAKALRIHFASLEANDKDESQLGETHSFIAGAADQSQTTIFQPTPGSISDPDEKTFLGHQQKRSAESKPADAQVPAEISATVSYISSNGIGVQQKGALSPGSHSWRRSVWSGLSWVRHRTAATSCHQGADGRSIPEAGRCLGLS